MANKSDSLIIYTAYADKFKRLTDAQFGLLMRCVLEYQITGIVPKIDDASVALSFDVIKFDIDSNNKKYDETVEKRKEAGAKGGKQKLANVNKSKQKVANASKSKQSQANLADNDNDNVNDNDYIASADAIKRGFSEDEDIINQYNEICLSFPRVAVMTEERKKLAREALTILTHEGIEMAFRRAESSTFLKSREWRVDYEWIIKHITQIFEGKYDDSEKQESLSELDAIEALYLKGDT